MNLKKDQKSVDKVRAAAIMIRAIGDEAEHLSMMSKIVKNNLNIINRAKKWYLMWGLLKI